MRNDLKVHASESHPPVDHSMLSEWTGGFMSLSNYRWRVGFGALVAASAACGGAENLGETDDAVITVDIHRELTITDLRVVEDSKRTLEPCTATQTSAIGPWTFGALITALAEQQGLDPPQMALDLFKNWEKNEVVNTFTAGARKQIDTDVIQPWQARSGVGKPLNLALAPLRLLAIVNRIDLRKVNAKGEPLDAGEGRFVFGVVDTNNCGGGEVLPFTVIFEFSQIASSTTAVDDTAKRWHRLGSFPLGSASYNAALQGVTDRFSRGILSGGKKIAFHLNQLRSNEIALAAPWELREFHAVPKAGFVEVTVKQTPDPSLDNTAFLASVLNENAAAINAGTFTLPAVIGSQHVLGASAPNQPTLWNAPGIMDPNVRHNFALNTCSGCHNLETGTFGFLHVAPRARGQATTLSGFLTGETVQDPVNHKTLKFNDLARRRAVLVELLTHGALATPAAADAIVE
jgi:hypothetical protein